MKVLALAVLLTWIPFCWQPLRGQTPGVGVKPGGDKKQHSEFSATQPKPDQRGTKDAPLVVDTKGHKSTEEEAAEDKKWAERKDYVERWTLRATIAVAVFTGLLVLVGLGGVIAAIRTLRAIEGQTNALIEGQRPQIAIEPHGDAKATIAEPKSPRIELSISNIGVTHAYNFTHETWIEILPVPCEDFTSKADYTPPSEPIILYPRHPIVLNIPIRPLITEEQMKRIRALELRVCVRLRVLYSDAFSPNRCVNFGFMVLPMGLSFMPKYNGDCSGD